MQNNERETLSSLFYFRHCMKRNLFSLLVLTVALMQTSCLEIIQTIEVHKDHSGIMSLEVDYSQIEGLSALTGQADAQRMVDAASRKWSRELAQFLRQQDGVSHVETSFSPQKGRNGISFRFRDEGSFNRAIYAIAGQNRAKPAILKLRNKKLKVRNLTPYIKLFLDEKAQNQLELFSGLVHVREVYKVPGKIRRASNRPQVTDQQQGITMRYYILSDVVEGKKNTGIKIRYQ